MKGVPCSWSDMQEIRKAISASGGNLSRIKRARCVSQSAVSAWKATCDILDAIEGRYQLTDVEHFQPTHAVEIARAFHCVEKDSQKWTDDTKKEIADWVDRCESEELTVKQLRDALSEVRGQAAQESINQRFDLIDECHFLKDWLLRRRESWPEQLRHRFLEAIRNAADQMEREDDAARGKGADSSEAG